MLSVLLCFMTHRKSNPRRTAKPLPAALIPRLGMVSDGKLAGLSGLSQRDVNRERNRLGIASYYSKIKAMRRICAYCNNPKPDHVKSHVKYCSAECRRAARIEYGVGRTPHGTCGNHNCEKLLYGRNLYFCSNECRWESAQLNRSPNSTGHNVVGLTEDDKVYILQNYERLSYRAIANNLSASHKPGAISGFIQRQGLRKLSLKPGSVAVA